MSLPDDAELVRQCAREGSQSAFAILVERHAPLVHSVARRLTGDTDLARDVTQRVFLDLLNKVSQVWELIEKQRSSGPAVLSGWLHRASRYEALELTRSERRRQARERQAMELLMQDSGEDPFWETVRPVVDEALDSLPEPDRRALLLRYFQGAGFREIGAALELSDDAAQKRVSRSLERLREQFAARGITTTAAALGVALAAHAVEPVPIGLADQIAAAVWTAPRSGLVGSSKMASAPQDSASTNAFSASLPVAAGLAVIALLGALLWLARRDGPATPVPESGSMVEEVAATPAVENAPGVAPSGATNEEQQLQLLVRSADSRAPVTNVLVVPYFTTERTQLLPTQFSDAFGRAEVTYPTNASVLTIDLRLEGYADTRLSWNRTRGLTIPAVQEVRLIRAPRIGGLVVNIAGVPLTNTMVQLHLPDGRPEIAQVESHTCELQIVTDSEGRWSTARVAEELFSRFEGTPWRKDHLSHGWTRFANQPEAIGQLLAGTYVFTLDTGLSFRGRVVDEFDAPVSGAVVLLGDYLSNQHSAQTTNNGEFVLG
ncbi:MAG TPA: hypothetical protein DCE44_17955, partial [Verrucomicrobiales bacterium]|nr:hypothetical protein [Verrucomicrobiales bacterium]